jgi:carbamoyl-phosphate synthase large subunit
MEIKRVFVSGGAGVIGQEVIPRLLTRGATVMVGDLKKRPANFPPEVIYRQGDLNDMTDRELRQFVPDVVIHLAATFERSIESYGFWDENFHHNVLLSHHLMTLVKNQSTIRRVVFASSYLVYDPFLYQFNKAQDKAVLLHEDDPIRPRNLTGMAKLAHEMELSFINGFQNQNFSTVCARIFRGYGCNSRDVISRWIRGLLQGEEVTVYRPEGMFDYIYAADSAEGLIRLAYAPDVPSIINLGTGQAHRVQDVVDILASHFPLMQTVKVANDIAFEASQADMTRFKEYINWLPEYDLERAIPEMIAFEREQLNLTAEPLRSTPLKILITSASKKVPLIHAARTAAQRIDQKAQVVSGDLSPDVLAAHATDEYWLMPPTSDSDLEAIIQGLLSRRINTVLPTRDGELKFWARHAEDLAKVGIAVIVSPCASIDRCIDKLAFAQVGSDQGLPIIPASETIDTLNSKSYVVKERFGAGSRSVGLDLNSEQALAHAETLKNPIFQPYIKGREFSVDAWVSRSHKVKGLVLRWRDTVVGGESLVTTTFSNTSLEANCKEVIEALMLRGPVVLQSLLDENGMIHVIECNPRFGGASTAGIAAGVDSLFWSLLEACGMNVEDYPFLPINGKVRQVRVPSDMYFYDSNI